MKKKKKKNWSSKCVTLLLIYFDVCVIKEHPTQI